MTSTQRSPRGSSRARAGLGRALALAGLSASFSFACAPASEPVPLPPPPPAPAIPPPTAALATSASVTDVQQRFAALRDRISDDWLRDNPSMARWLGFHEYDGKVSDYTEAAITARLARLREQQRELAAIRPADLAPDDALDHAILTGRVDLLLFLGEDLEDWRRQPRYYEDLFAVDGYLIRDYAPLDARGRSLLAHERAALTQVANIRKNLRSPMSKPVLTTAVGIFRGYAEYLRKDVPLLLKGAGDAAFQAELAATNEALAKEAEGFASHLAKVEAPKGDQSHILGAERYQRLLRAQEGLTISLADFKRMGEDDLAANKKAYEELYGKVKETRPKASELFAEAARMTALSRQFLVDKKLLTLPSEDRPILRESPPFMRWNAAFLNDPGPFEKAIEAYYYITLPDTSWSKKEQEEYVMSYGSLLSTTVHEVYPGHFVQGQWTRRAPTKVQKIMSSYSFVEGWAHYAEQLMIEEGLGAEDPQNRLGQLGDALLRNCRMVVSLGIHAEEMSIEQAEKRFMADCHQDKATARQQAARATFDPGYFAYTLGKLQILALREEAKRRLGDRFSLQRFHDALLSHGSPPVPLLRERVLNDLGASP